MKEIRQERNNWFDVIKFVASFFVICIHIPLVGGDFEIAVNAIARFAVPTFFAISGFYILGADAVTVKCRIIKILKLYLISAAIYHTSSIIGRVFEQGIMGLINYILSVFFNIGNIASFLIFNIPFTSVHLWFMLALMYVYLIWLVILKHSLKDKTILLIGILTLLVNLVLGELLSSFGIVLDYIIVRNFAFTGLPFFIFGYLLRKYSHLFEKIRPLFLILAIVIGSCEAVLSRFLVGHNEVFIGSVLCCLSVVLLAEKIKNKEIPSKYLPVFRSSTDVYVFHILFSGFLYSLANILPLTVGTVMRMFMPCLTFAICIAFSLLKSRIIKWIKQRRAFKCDEI
jgi:surface polysaccharide O-acyltransferase-like enzyme